jgi:hypothetical protein
MIVPIGNPYFADKRIDRIRITSTVPTTFVLSTGFGRSQSVKLCFLCLGVALSSSKLKNVGRRRRTGFAESSCRTNDSVSSVTSFTVFPELPRPETCSIKVTAGFQAETSDLLEDSLVSS